MTATIINLRQVRKDRQRERDHKMAAEQRARFGKSKAERTSDAQRQAHDAARLDGHRLSPAAPSPDDDGRR